MATAELERLRSPRVLGAPHPLLAPHLARRHTGFVERTRPRHLVIPASATVSLVVKLRDSAHRPPAFVTGPHHAHLVPDGECSPSYLEVRLSPLSGYTLLGVPLNALRGRIVDLRDLLGADGRRLAERLREARTWRERFTLSWTGSCWVGSTAALSRRPRSSGSCSAWPRPVAPRGSAGSPARSGGATST